MVVFDTNVLIYFLEQNADHFADAEAALDQALRLEGDIACSVITMAEIIRGAGEQSALMEFFEQPQVKVLPVDEPVARLAGQICREHNYRLPDALILATAVINDAHTIVTNDNELLRWRHGFHRAKKLEDYIKPGRAAS